MNTFSGPGALGPPPQDDYTTAPPLVGTPPRQTRVDQDAEVASDNNTTPIVRQRPSRAAAGEDFLSIMRMQMTQDREDHKEERIVRAEERRDAIRVENMRREERDNDCKSMENMFMMAVGGFAAYSNKSKKRNSQAPPPSESDDEDQSVGDQGVGDWNRGYKHSKRSAD